MPEQAAELLPLLVADIFQVAGAFRDRGEAIAKGIGQTQARWQVLSAASASTMTVPQIARRLGVARQSVQRLADLLAGEGSARFAANPDHKGSPHFVLTGRGRAVLVRLTEAAAHSHRQLAKHVDPKPLQAVHHGLRHLIAALNVAEG